MAAEVCGRSSVTDGRGDGWGLSRGLGRDRLRGRGGGWGWRRRQKKWWRRRRYIINIGAAMSSAGYVAVTGPGRSTRPQATACTDDDDHGVADLDAVAIGQGRQRVDLGSVDGGFVRAPQIGDAEAFPVNGEAEVTARDLLVGEQQPLDLPSCIEGDRKRRHVARLHGLTDEELERGHAAITQPAPPGALRARTIRRNLRCRPTSMPPNASATPAPRRARRTGRGSSPWVPDGTGPSSPRQATPNTAPMSARPNGPVFVLLPSSQRALEGLAVADGEQQQQQRDPEGTLSSSLCDVSPSKVASCPARSPRHRVTLPVKLPLTR